MSKDMDDKNDRMPSSEWIGMVQAITKVSTKLDMLLERFDRTHEENSRRFSTLESRVDTLESTKDKIGGKISVIAFVVASATTAIIGALVKFLMGAA